MCYPLLIPAFIDLSHFTLLLHIKLFNLYSLVAGLDRYGYGQWKKILEDKKLGPKVRSSVEILFRSSNHNTRHKSIINPSIIISISCNSIFHVQLCVYHIYIIFYHQPLSIYYLYTIFIFPMYIFVYTIAVQEPKQCGLEGPRP